jgi:hypothetical protein
MEEAQLIMKEGEGVNIWVNGLEVMAGGSISVRCLSVDDE